MFRLLLMSHLQAEPQKVLYTINNVLWSKGSRLHGYLYILGSKT